VKHAKLVLFAAVVAALLLSPAGCVALPPPLTPAPVATQPPSHSNERDAADGRDTPAPTLPPSPEPSPVPTPEPLPCDIAARVFHDLTRPAFGGRITGTEGTRLAALYLAEVMEELGLLPWESDSFFHEYPQLFGTRSTGLNVVGVIPGKDRGQAIVVSAHYDAIFFRPHTSTEGALDNASGVAAMLRVASSLLRLGVQPETDIVFAAFDGEEVGLLGSRAFVPVAAARYGALFNINIDCVGLEGARFVFNFTDDTAPDHQLRQDMADVFTRHGIAWAGTQLTITSDNLSFAAFGIPNVPITLNLATINAIIHTARDIAEVVCILLVEALADAVADFIVMNHGRMY
jgi:hypothetical protein